MRNAGIVMMLVVLIGICVQAVFQYERQQHALKPSAEVGQACDPAIDTLKTVDGKYYACIPIKSEWKLKDGPVVNCETHGNNSSCVVGNSNKVTINGEAAQ